MASLRSSDQLIRGVPLTDGNGSVALLLAQNLEEARRLVEGDPMIRAAVMRADLYERRTPIQAD